MSIVLDPHNLRVDRFMTPNQVLCYGGGKLAALLIPLMLKHGINVIGIIDKNKSGSEQYQGRDLQYYTTDQALERFGTDVIVIITIADAALYSEITALLISKGVNEDAIYEYDVYNWLTVPSNKCYCSRLFETIVYHADGLRTCCYNTEEIQSFRFEPFNRGVQFEENIQRAVAKLKWYREQAYSGNVPIHCSQCPKLIDKNTAEILQYQFIEFGAHTLCNMDCVYCEYNMSTPQESPFFSHLQHVDNFVQFIDAAKGAHLISENCCLSFAGGEISISPANQQLLELAYKYPNSLLQIDSNCAVYSEVIAEMLERNTGNTLLCDLDAGTPETYILVKGFDYFNQVVENLKRYQKHGNIAIKYIVMPGFNTSDENYLGQIRVLEYLNLKQITLSIEGLHKKNVFDQRKAYFEIGRFMVLLEQHGIRTVFNQDYLTIREQKIISRFYNQLLKTGRHSDEASENSR